MYPVEKVDVKDQTGAGDTFIVGLMLKYLETNNIGDAITFANKCATYVVQKRGVAVTLPYEN
jgi:ribokinase